MQSSNGVSEETSSRKLKISDSKAFIKMIEVSDPTGFGRDLAKIIFGTDANCLLVDFTVGQGARSNCKAGVYFSLESLFETVVRDRFPDDTEYCLSRAFDAANQVGRDCRRQLLVQTFGRNRFI